MLKNSACLKLRNLYIIFNKNSKGLLVDKFNFLYKICFVFEIVFFCLYEAISVKTNSEKYTNF